jgi:hypothetical protein
MRALVSPPHDAGAAQGIPGCPHVRGKAGCRQANGGLRHLGEADLGHSEAPFTGEAFGSVQANDKM